VIHRRRLSGMPSSALPLVALLVAALSLTLLTAGTARATATAAATDPSKDYFNMPDGCAQPGKIIPQVPQGCRLTRFVKSRPTVMVWGDSHAWQHLPALVPLARQHNVNLTVFTLGGCPPVQYPYRGDNRRDYPGLCHHSNALALHYAKKMTNRSKPFLAVVGSHWAGFRDHYQRFFVEGQTPTCDQAKPYVMEMSRLSHDRTPKLFSALRRNHIRTVATSPMATVPPLRNAGPCVERDEPFVGKLKRRAAILHEGRTRNWLRGQMAGIPGNPDLVDINGAYCGPRYCRGMVDGVYTWYDDLHISATRMRKSRGYWAPLIRGL
jgi:SGNH domain-containing protein